MAVRTARLATGASAAAGTTKVIYTCPAGVTAIVKDARLSKNVGGAVQTNLGVRSGPDPVWLINRSLPDTEPLFGSLPWIVLEPGDQLVLLANVAAAYQYWISGTELEGVAP